MKITINLENYTESTDSNGMATSVPVNIDVKDTTEDQIVKGFRDYIRRMYQNKYIRKYTKEEIAAINTNKTAQNFDIQDLMSRGTRKEKDMTKMSKEEKLATLRRWTPEELEELNAAIALAKESKESK